jgi:tetratricopeptide (TPR) repeat protein
MRDTPPQDVADTQSTDANHPKPRRRLALPPGRITGAAWGWAIVAIALVALIGGALAIRFGVFAGGDRSATPSATQPSEASYDKEAASRQTAQLQKQFSNVITAEGDPSTLVDSARALVDRYPRYVPARQLYGQLLLRSGEFEAGYDQVQKALAMKDQARPELQIMAGTLAMQMRRYEQALHHFSEATSLKPESVKYRVQKAQALIEMQRYEKARHELLVALRQDSTSYRAHGSMAQLYANKGQLPQARKHIRQAIEHLPQNKSKQRAALVRQRAELLRRSNRPSEAIQVLRDLSSEQIFTNPSVLEELAWNWQMLGKPANAAALYGQALAMLPNHQAIAEGAIKWALEAEQYDKARQHLEALRRIAPHSPALREYRDKLEQLAGTAKQP